MPDLVLHLQLTIAAPVFIFRIPTGLTKAKHSQRLHFKRDRDVEMRKLVKRKQKGAARNSKFLQVELNFPEGCTAQHQCMPSTEVLRTGKTKWAQIISPQGRLLETRS